MGVISMDKADRLFKQTVGQCVGEVEEVPVF